MPNILYTYILNIYDLQEKSSEANTIFKRVRSHLFVKWFQALISNTDNSI